ncbi:hypothetical protein [Rubellimicrobium roseum]|uniref:Uncharacterized protein n=1 Tax=Rubellimicrobium roseum TaxID=687525 RepID=A0A5C4NHC6_9RHOB|nr:hypothetical protein [Rubellimicrobium roseum]TNC74161.1 hypothetical protein FHG71_02920 [Rubellimicrobium roseum]
MNVEVLRQLYHEMQIPYGNALRPTGGLAPIEFVSEAAQGRRLYLGSTWPREHLSEEELLLSSLQYACSVVARYAADRGVYVLQLDPAMEMLEKEVVPFRIEGGIPGKRGSFGYHFRESREGVLTELFDSSPKVARELLKRIGLNLWEGIETPEEAKSLACGVLWELDKVRREPANRPSNAHRDTLLVGIADRLKMVAGYPTGGEKAQYFRGEKPPVCGCTIAAAALDAFGVDVDAIRAFKINQAAKTYLQNVRDIDELLRPNGMTVLNAQQGSASDDHADPVLAALAYFFESIPGGTPKKRRA